MFQIPKIRVRIVAVSRDCSPEKLSVDRRKAVVKACRESQEGEDFYECPICIVEIEENSELDLFEACNRHAGDPGIPKLVRDMEEELGEEISGRQRPEILLKLAQYELTMLDWLEKHKGYRKYVAAAGKCWPAFQTQFGFVPCYVNIRLTGRGFRCPVRQISTGH